MIHICKLHDLKFPCIYVYALCLLKYRKVLIIWTMMVDSLKKTRFVWRFPYILSGPQTNKKLCLF